MKEEVVEKKRWVCYRMNKYFGKRTKICINYFCRHSERLSQHAETKAAEARSVLKTQCLLSANILDYHILQVLKYELKTFHSYVQHSKTYVWLFFNFHSIFLNVLYLLLQAMSLRQKRMRLRSHKGRRGRAKRRHHKQAK